jgi:hypothetical protein
MYDLCGRASDLYETFQVVSILLPTLELLGGTDYGGGLLCLEVLGLTSRGLCLEEGVEATTTEVEFGI